MHRPGGPPLISASLLAGGLLLLFAGADLLVRGARTLGLRLGLSPLVAGLTIVAFGTSAPELLVSLQAALQGYPELALANVVGSNICNVALILGCAALVRPIRIHTQVVRWEVPVLIGVSLALCLLWLAGGPGRPAGSALVAGIVLYTWSSVRRARREFAEVGEEFARDVPQRPRSAWTEALEIGLGLGGLLAGSALFLKGAVMAAELLGVPRGVVGLTVVAVGTSLPELASSVVAALRGHGDIAVGNVIGSNIFNILGILGATTLVRPLGPDGVGSGDLGTMLALALVLLVFVYTQRAIERWEGGLLLLAYALYLRWLIAV